MQFRVYIRANLFRIHARGRLAQQTNSRGCEYTSLITVILNIKKNGTFQPIIFMLIGFTVIAKFKKSKEYYVKECGNENKYFKYTKIRMHAIWMT